MYFNWSSGKDASLALYYLLQNTAFDIRYLLTSVNAHYDRVSMHGTRRELLEAQAQTIGIPLKTIELPETPTMEVYEQKMTESIEELKSKGIYQTAFGDIFLEDLKNYRVQQLEKVGIEAHFPLWKRDTKELLLEMLRLGFKTVVVCIKAELLDESFVGRVIDEQFIEDLPDNVDICGENGEFHTFCFDGPIFKKPIPIKIGEKTYRSYENPQKDKAHTNDKKMGFWFCDILLGE